MQIPSVEFIEPAARGNERHPLHSGLAGLLVSALVHGNGEETQPGNSGSLGTRL